MANQPCIPEVDLAAPQRMVLFFCNRLVSEGFLHVSSWQVGQVIFVLYVVLGIDVMLASEHEPSNPPLFLFYEQICLRLGFFFSHVGRSLQVMPIRPDFALRESL